jgi:hypothetical protein
MASSFLLIEVGLLTNLPSPHYLEPQSTTILPISSYQVARIAGMSHNSPLKKYFLNTPEREIVEPIKYPYLESIFHKLTFVLNIVCAFGW